MQIIFDKKQLNTDVKMLEEKKIPKETAKKIALFKQAVELSNYFEDSIPFMDRTIIPEEIFDKLDNLKGFLEDACNSIQELFMSDDEAKINGASDYRKAIYQ